MDRAKANEPNAGYYADCTAIQSQFGDLIIWHQILDEARKRKAGGAILITDDEKEDWWQEQSGRTVGPRRELIDEMRIVGGVQRFHMYNSERFMEYAKDNLGVTIQADSIEQVARVKVVSKPHRQDTERFRAIEEWLEDYYEAQHISVLPRSIAGNFADFALTVSGRCYGIVVVPRVDTDMLRRAERRVESAIVSRKFDEVHVLIASANQKLLDTTANGSPVTHIKKSARVKLLKLTRQPNGIFEVTDHHELR